MGKKKIDRDSDIARVSSSIGRLNDVGTASLEVQFEFGPVTIYQDPNSRNCGTSVWDASVVLSKYIEKAYYGNRLKGKRVLEVGAGCGLVGIFMAVKGTFVDRALISLYA
jgi:hypothetical protein